MTETSPGRARDADLAEKSDAICRLGALMLTSGTGSYRVKAAMGRVAAALGIDELEAQVSLNEIVLTTRQGKAFRTQVVEVPVPVVNTDRIGALMRLSLRVASGLSAAELHGLLDEVEARPRLYQLWMVVLAAAGAGAAFALLNNGRWQECLAAALGSAAGKTVQLVVGRLRLNQLAVVAAAAATAAAAYLLVADVLHLLLPGGQPLHEAAFVSAILFLVPGFPLVTAALDLARFDFTSGLSRLTFAALITLAAALGAWVVGWAFGLTPAEIPAPAEAWYLLAAVWVMASFVGVFGFAITFNTPVRVAAVAAVIGAVANPLRLWALQAGWPPLLATVLATTAIGVAAGWASQRILAPRITLSVPAVLIMIPGAATYRAAVALINHDAVSALANGSAAISIVVALAAGLAIARMLTDPAWIAANPIWTRMPSTHAQRVLRSRRDA
jgi:uncharacterized membrane protein YjjP (DUF1212 family)